MFLNIISKQLAVFAIIALTLMMGVNSLLAVEPLLIGTHNIDGEAAGDNFSYNLAAIGDVNNDGYDDYLSGAPYAKGIVDVGGVPTELDVGRAYVYSGKDGSTLYTYDGDSTFSCLDSKGVTRGAYFGRTVSGGKDINNDGFDDFMIAGRDAKVRVYSGKDGSLIYDFAPDHVQLAAGIPISVVGDLNGDGHAEFFVGIDDWHNNIAPDPAFKGYALLYSGIDGSLVHTFEGVRIDYFGHYVADIGDVTGDGVSELIVGAFLAQNGGVERVGKAVVFDGADAFADTTTTIFTVFGDSDREYFGLQATGAGDVNNDGTPDFIVGGFLADHNGRIDSGTARVFSGKDGSQLYQFDGDSADDELGYSISAAGDVNNDGFDDVIVGAPAGYQYVIDTRIGYARIYSGKDGGILRTFRGDAEGDRFSARSVKSGDFNGDGEPDAIVSAFNASNNGVNSGSLRIFYSGNTSDNINHPSGITLDYTEGDGAVIFGNTYAIYDPDVNTALPNISRATIQITGNYDLNKDELLIDATDLLDGVTSLFDAPSGTLTLSGLTSAKNYEKMLEKVKFTNINNFPSELNRTVTWKINDGTAESTGFTSTVTVKAMSTATVSTQAVTDITALYATGNGNITSLGDTDPTQHGICWNTTGTPTVADNKTEEGAVTTTGAFTSSIINLTPVTIYYVRAYATNSLGTAYGEQQTFTTKEITSQLYTVTFVEGEHGVRTGGGALVQTVQYGNDATEPILSMDPGWGLDGWDTPFTNVTNDLTVTAQYINLSRKPVYDLKYTANDNGSITGFSTQTVIRREDGKEVTAVPDAGYIFVDWSDNVTTASRTDTNITADINVIANFTLDPATFDKITYGSLISVRADEISGMGDEFTKRPKVYGTYTDPVKSKNYKATTKGLTKINKKTPSDVYESEWNRSVVLYDKQALSAANKNGESTANWLTSTPIEPLITTLYLEAKKADKTKIKNQFRYVRIAPPEISSITCWDGSDASSGLHKDSIIIIKGNYFGTKLPTVSLEYTDPKGAIKLQRLKVQRVYKYADAKGVLKSCMDSTTGASQIYVDMTINNLTPGTYSLVLNNKVGIALDTGTGTLPIINMISESTNTAPVANNDTKTIETGVVKYNFDVLANDTDAEGDKLIITLDEKTSNLGGKISVKNGKISYTMPQDIAASVDTFTYNVDDGHGKTSSATVTIFLTVE